MHGKVCLFNRKTSVTGKTFESYGHFYGHGSSSCSLSKENKGILMTDLTVNDNVISLSVKHAKVLLQFM